MNLTFARVNSSQCQIRYDTVRGMFYKLQSCPSFGEAFADDGGGFTQAMDTFSVRTQTANDSAKFFRAVSAGAP